MTMTKQRATRFCLLLLAVCLLFSFASCEGEETVSEPQNQEKEHIDYAASITLDMNSTTAKEEATVKAYVDGDTTHFYVSASAMPGGVLKARYLAINTPESTGKIEEWGKTAAQYTKSKLQSATSIILESETAVWTPDSTGSRYLCWVWYRTSEAEPYRNLNIEILQEGLAIASNSANNRYGATCTAAIDQAKAEKLHVHSDDKDPNFPYGQATELTLKELRTNITTYDNCNVAFEGVVVMDNNQTVYVEEYDPETDMYYGMQVYYGYNLNGAGLQILSVGNRVRIVGTVQYYETGGTYQISGVDYKIMKPDDPSNLQLISSGHTAAYTLLDAATFTEGNVEILVGEENKTFSFAELSIYTSVEMKDLQVVDLYTTTNEESASKGAITITCKNNGKTVTLRTVVLYDEEGNLVTEEYFRGKTISVKGLVDYFDGTYQIKIYSLNDVTVQ